MLYALTQQRIKLSKRQRNKKCDQAARLLSSHLICNHESEFSAAIIDEMHMNLKVKVNIGVYVHVFVVYTT